VSPTANYTMSSRESAPLAVAIVVPDVGENALDHYGDESIPVARVDGSEATTADSVPMFLRLGLGAIVLIATVSLMLTKGDTSRDASPIYEWTERPTSPGASDCESGILDHLKYLSHHGWSSLDCFDYDGTIPTQIGLYSSTLTSI
jgi:hypothetical protein